jgi:mercuric ion transport protein
VEPARVRYTRMGYFILSWVLFICIIVQVYLAGVAIFDNPAAWIWHKTFVHIFEYISVIMFILGFIGKLPWRIIWGSLGLFALFNIQYYTAHGIAGALHPILALVLFWGSLTLARSSYKFLFKR